MIRVREKFKQSSDSAVRGKKWIKYFETLLTIEKRKHVLRREYSDFIPIPMKLILNLYFLQFLCIIVGFAGKITVE